MGRLLFPGTTSDIASRISSFIDIDSGKSVKVAWETGLRDGKWRKIVEIGGNFAMEQQRLCLGG